MEAKWGQFEFDRFANHRNFKVDKFNLLYWCPDTSGVDAFTKNWHGVNNWLVPPIFLVGDVLKQLEACHAFGVLVVPFWTSPYFWPLLIERSGAFISQVKDFYVFENSGVLRRGLFKKCIFGSEKFISKVIAFRLDFT